jgi:hypothetical protein
MAATTTRRSPNGTARRSSGATLVAKARRAKTPAVAGGAAAAGIAAGTVLGAALRGGKRRSHVLGMPLPRAGEVKAGAQQVARAGRFVYELQSDVRLLREQAHESQRQSPIEVLLSGLTSRTLPRRR